MKKIIALLLAMTLCFGLVACGGAAEETTAPDTETTAPEAGEEAPEEAATALAGVVNTDGSTSMESVVGILNEAFGEINPDVTVNYSGTGSGSGIEGAIAGTVDIGLASRALKADEEAEGAVGHVVALDGVAVIVNPESGVTDLTVEQIAAIFSGEITNFAEVGGVDGPIAAFGREAGSGTRGAFEEIVGVEDACVYTNEYSSTGDVIGNVASNPNAIGYASLSAIDESVVAVKVNGVEISEATIADGTYAIQRPFLMVTKDGTELSPQAQAFLDYAMSAEVAEYITMAGAVSPNA